MFSYDAHKIAKRNNKDYKKASRLIQILCREGYLGGNFSSLTVDSINMLQSDGYNVQKRAIGYFVSWAERIN